MNQKKYPALRFISGFYRFIGYTVGTFSIIVPIIIFIGVLKYNDNFIAGISAATAIYFLIGGLITATLILAFSEGIMVILDIEDNTKRTALNSLNFKANNDKAEKIENEVFCPNCGKSCLNESIHCVFCGHKL